MHQQHNPAEFHRAGANAVDRSILQSITTGIITTDLDGRVEFVNAAAEQLIEMANDSAEGCFLNEIFLLEEKFEGPIVSNLVELAIVSGDTIALSNNVLLLPHRGEPKQIDGEISVRTEGDHIVGTVVTFRDAAARNREELQRREDQKMHLMSQFAGSVAHELNNALTVVVGHSELLGRSAPQGPLRTHALAIQTGSQSIAGLARQLLTLSRRELLQPIAINLNHLLIRSAEKLNRLPPGIELSLTLSPDLEMVLVDPAQMEQALVELVQHSANRMPGGGKISLATANLAIDEKHRARHLKRYIRLTVTDSGPSLAGLETAELFQPSWNRKPGRPAGLGMFTVRNLMSATGGHLSIGSVESGAQLVLLFPQTDHEVPAFLAPENAGKLAGKETLLLVEDDDAIRILLCNSLEKEGYKVIEARDGEEAILQADLYEDPIDLLLTDVVMPNMNGPALSQNLTAARPDIKVLMISGCPDDVDEVKKLVKNGAHYMLKPFTQRELVARVKEILRDRNRALSK